MAKVNWTDQAIEDVNNIAEFISKESFRYAEIQVNKLFQLSTLLEDNPKLGRNVPEINDLSIRELISGNYRLIYKIRTPEEVVIITIHHSKRMLSNNPNL